MKFVALALALLLAVGSRAASLQADSPSQLQHIRSLADMYMTQGLESAKKILEGLDETEYKELKNSLVQRLEDGHAQIKALQQTVSPMTDNVFNTVAEATAEMRASLMQDVETLKTDLESHRAKLREVITKHVEEYRTLMEPVVREHMEKHNAEMEALKLKMQPVVDELRTKVATNVEETKTALIPIVEALRNKVTERVEALKTAVSPYVTEYQEQMKQAYGQVQGISGEEITALKEKITPLAEDVKAKLQAIFEAIAATVTKN